MTAAFSIPDIANPCKSSCFAEHDSGVANAEQQPLPGSNECLDAYMAMDWMSLFDMLGPDALQVREELAEVGVASEAADKILAAMATRSLEDLEKLLGPDNEAVADLQQLFRLAEAYGMADWLVFDASVVRGLSYYTGEQYQPSIH